MSFDDRAADRQAHPQAAGLGRVEGLEEVLEALRSQPGPEPRNATSTPFDLAFPVLISNSREPRRRRSLLRRRL